jgi:hypothetical protein
VAIRASGPLLVTRTKAHQSLGWFRSICRMLCQRDSPARGQRTRNKHRTYVLDGRLWVQLVVAAASRLCPIRLQASGDSGVAPPGPRPTGPQWHPATNRAQARRTRSWTSQGSTYRCRRLSAALCPIRLSLRR